MWGWVSELWARDGGGSHKSRSAHLTLLLVLLQQQRLLHGVPAAVCSLRLHHGQRGVGLAQGGWGSALQSQSCVWVAVGCERVCAWGSARGTAGLGLGFRAVAMRCSSRNRPSGGCLLQGRTRGGADGGHRLAALLAAAAAREAGVDCRSTITILVPGVRLWERRRLADCGCEAPLRDEDPAAAASADTAIPVVRSSSSSPCSSSSAPSPAGGALLPGMLTCRVAWAVQRTGAICKVSHTSLA